MKAYLATTGTIFALIVIAHVWRVIGESRALAHDPWFLLITILAAGLSFWGFRLLRSGPGPAEVNRQGHRAEP